MPGIDKTRNAERRKNSDRYQITFVRVVQRFAATAAMQPLDPPHYARRKKAGLGHLLLRPFVAKCGCYRLA
jgi:hypothetical protein